MYSQCSRKKQYQISYFIFIILQSQDQPWTKLVETKVENPVNSRNGSIFQIPNSPPYPSISMLNLAKFCCQKLKTLRTTLIYGERDFFTEKQVSKHQLKRLATKIRMVTKVSFKIRKYVTYILPKCLFEAWDKMMMVLEQQPATPELEFDKILTV